MRRGYLTPPVIAALALIALFVAGTLYFHTFFLKGLKNQPAPSPSPTSSITPSPKSTPDETANWKTYRNEKSGYQLKYPSDVYTPELYTETYNPFGTKDVSINEDLCFLMIKSEGGCYGVISLSHNTIDQYIRVNKNFNKDSFELIEEDSIVDGVPAKIVYYKSIPGKEIQFLDILIENNGKLYILNRDVGNEDYIEDEIKILSTFKFLE